MKNTIGNQIKLWFHCLIRFHKSIRLYEDKNKHDKTLDTIHCKTCAYLKGKL